MSRDARVRELFSRARALGDEERRRFLDRTCAGDDALRLEVEELVAEGEGLDGFLEEPAVDAEGCRGERIGPYVLQRVLGRGGMGVVYLALRTREGGAADAAPVALKTVRVAATSLLAGVRREIQALVRLSHPGIVHILDVGMQDGAPWYAMELIQAVTLRDWARERARDAGNRSFLAPESDASWWTRAFATAPGASCVETVADARALPPAGGGALAAILAVVRKLCGALAYLHGEGFVHRDVKPANVLVRPDGTPVLVDFGLMTRFTGGGSREVLEAAGESLGTAAYVAPEQGSGELVDARADLYALGVVLYELVTGRLPFEGASDWEVLSKRYAESPAPPSRHARDVPEALDQLVLSLLAREPRARTGHAGVVAAALARLGAGVDPLPGPAPASYLYRPSLCGRRGAMAHVEEAVLELECGRGGVLLVSGESGVGKTRLALAISQLARHRRHEVLAAECADATPPAAGTALAAFRSILTTIADLGRAGGLPATEELLGERGPVLAAYEPAIATLPGQEHRSAPPELPAGEAVSRVARAVAESVLALGRLRSTVVILEDLQWADALCMDVVAHLARSPALAGVPLLLVATRRSEEADVAPGWSDRVARLDLDRLDHASIEEMVADMLAMAEPPRELIAHLVRHSEGVPFYVAEYLHLAVDAGILARDAEGTWCLERDPEEVGGLPVPGSIRSLVSRRLAALEAGDRALFETAALLGRECDGGLLGELAGIGERELADALSRLSRRKLVECDPTGVVRLAHDKLRDLASTGITPPRARELHRRAAEALTRRRPEPGARGEAGRHWEGAGEPALARSCYLDAARDASALFAPDRAEAMYRSYLRLVDTPSAESIEARLELGEKVLQLRGHTIPAEEALRRALEEARRAGERSLEGRGLRLLGRLQMVTGRAGEGRTTLSEALAIARELHDRRAESRALHQLVNLERDAGRRREAVRLGEEGLAIARDTGDLDLEGQLLAALAVLREGEKSGEISRGLYVRALEIHRRSGNLRSEGVVLSQLAGLERARGRRAEARELYERALEVHRRVGNRRSEGVVLGNLAAICEDEGETEMGMALLHRAIAIVREVGERRAEAAFLANLGSRHRHRRDLQAARALEEQALAIARELSDPIEGFILGSLSLIERDEGRIEEARRLAALAIACHRSSGDRSREGNMLNNLAELEREAGRMDEARPLLEAARGIARDLGDRILEGVVLGNLALLELVVTGDAGRAETTVEEGRRALEEGGDARELGILSCALGHIQLARGAEADAAATHARAADLAAILGVSGADVEGLVASLGRAREARAAGLPLVAGFHVADLPPGQLRWLREHRPDAIPAPPA